MPGPAGCSRAQVSKVGPPIALLEVMSTSCAQIAFFFVTLALYPLLHGVTDCRREQLSPSILAGQMGTALSTTPGLCHNL